MTATSEPITPPLAVPQLARPSTCGRLAACAAVVLAFLVPAVAVTAAWVRAGVQFFDQEDFHRPTIEQFAAQWPAFDLHAYPAAMTPGYHLSMAALLHAGASPWALHAATAAVTALLLAILAWAVSARVPPADAVLLCLPFAWSSYVFTSGVYLVPHNPTWLGVLAVMLLALRPRVRPWAYPAFGLGLLALVLFRQIHLWAAAPMAAAAWCGDEAGGVEGDGRGLGAEARIGWIDRRRLARVAAVAALSLPAAVAVVWFVRKWGGPTPATKAFVAPAAGVNGAAILMVLATFGAWGPFFLPRLAGRASAGASGLGEPRPSLWRWAAIGAGLAAALAVVQPSMLDASAGRWTGFWNLTPHFPSVGGRSVLMAVLATAGGGVVAATLAGLPPRARWVVGAALAAFVAAHAAVDQAWQRFYDPLVLMTLALAYGPLQPAAPRARTWAYRGGLALLAGVQVAVTYVSLRTR